MRKRYSRKNQLFRYEVLKYPKRGKTEVVLETNSLAEAEKYAMDNRFKFYGSFNVLDRERQRGVLRVQVFGVENPLTRKKALLILHHKKVRGHKLTARQRRFFGARASRYAYRKNPSLKKSSLLYTGIGRCTDMKKGPGHKCDPGCARAGHRYFHDFTSKPAAIGLAPGSLNIPKGCYPILLVHKSDLLKFKH